MRDIIKYIKDKLIKPKLPYYVYSDDLMIYYKFDCAKSAARWLGCEYRRLNYIIKKNLSINGYFITTDPTTIEDIERNFMEKRIW